MPVQPPSHFFLTGRDSIRQRGCGDRLGPGSNRDVLHGPVIRGDDQLVGCRMSPHQRLDHPIGGLTGIGENHLDTSRFAFLHRLGRPPVEYQHDALTGELAILGQDAGQFEPGPFAITSKKFPQIFPRVQDVIAIHQKKRGP